MSKNLLSKLLKSKDTKKEDIKFKLSDYSRYHSYYSFYAAIDDKKQYDEKKFYLYFSLPKCWEDEIDKEKYKNISKDKLCFVRCLSYQKSESIAMWHMYGVPNNVRISINAKVLREKLGLNKNKRQKLNCYLICKDNKNGKYFQIDSSNIDKFDLLYYSLNHNKNKSYYVQKGDSVVVRDVNGELISQIKDEFYTKRFAFASEVETRLQVSLKEEFLINNLPNGVSKDDICGLAIEPNFDKKDIESIKIVRRPNFLDVRKIKREVSEKEFIPYKENKDFPLNMYAENIMVECSELEENY